MSSKPVLSVVIPVFNERESLPITLERVAKVDVEKEIILIDDASTDGTRDLLKRIQDDPAIVPGLAQVPHRIVFHEHNKGKGSALRTGFSHAAGEYVIIQDADLEYDPADYPGLLEPLLAGRADVVYGSRLAGGGAHRVLFFWHYLGNAALTLLSNMFTNLNLTDMETGYKIFRRSLLDKFTINSERFGVEPELTAKFSKLKCRIYEVPISYHGRTYEQGKKITWKDGLAAFIHIVRYRFFD
jgi:glycosyltransferase involved in cell wall biosynthesis